MLNLSEIVKKDSSTPFINKINLYLLPDIYLSENMKDFQDEDFSKTRIPLYNKLTLNNKAYIIFQDIGLDKLKDNWFILHDSSGENLAYWGDNKNLVYSSLTSFDEVKASQGLKEEDWVYEILAKYFISEDFLTIMKVDKYPYSRINKKDSIFDKINNIIPKPVMQPVF